MKRKTRDSEFIYDHSEGETEYNNEEAYDAGVIDQESSDSYEEETETDPSESYVNVNKSMTLEIYRDNQKLWEEKARFLLQSDDDTPSSVFERAGIYAEFGKIVCISVGLINDKETNRELRIKSYASDYEKELLVEFAEFTLLFFLLCSQFLNHFFQIVNFLPLLFFRNRRV